MVATTTAAAGRRASSAMSNGNSNSPPGKAGRNRRASSAEASSALAVHPHNRSNMLALSARRADLAQYRARLGKQQNPQPGAAVMRSVDAACARAAAQYEAARGAGAAAFAARRSLAVDVVLLLQKL